jgi:hypothetical protein
VILTRRGFLRTLGAAGAAIALGVDLEEILHPGRVIFLPAGTPNGAMLGAWYAKHLADVMRASVEHANRVRLMHARVVPAYMADDWFPVRLHTRESVFDSLQSSKLFTPAQRRELLG